MAWLSDPMAIVEFTAMLTAAILIAAHHHGPSSIRERFWFFGPLILMIIFAFATTIQLIWARHDNAEISQAELQTNAALRAELEKMQEHVRKLLALETPVCHPRVAIKSLVSFDKEMDVEEISGDTTASDVIGLKILLLTRCTANHVSVLIRDFDHPLWGWKVAKQERWLKPDSPMIYVNVADIKGRFELAIRASGDDNEYGEKARYDELPIKDNKDTILEMRRL